MKKKTLLDIIFATLKKREGERITGRKLAEAIVAENPEWVAQKRSNSKNSWLREGGELEMVLQVQSEIGSNKYGIERHKNLRMTEDRPRRFYYTALSEEEEVSAVEDSEQAKSGSDSEFTEHQLYPLLAKYLRQEHSVFSMRIREGKSKNTNGPKGNKWLHPDLIGFEVLGDEWSNDIKELVHSRSDPTSLLWSFEVKKLINRSNVREVFFQALSNSAWANKPYLVASEISGNGTLEELRMLASQHGVGVIVLATSPENESTILIQAVSRDAVDWTAANRLSEQNSDAEQAFRQVRIFHQSREINEEFWEKSWRVSL